ncbi:MULTISPECIES: endonuclease/exonuclease/phosphatase family protein [unclassified Pseudomonas]|uniref:endonuclease/exonuclease/phosphatase family protein n=1 Tax=unclassified Pseudomonas TaxID=196821 RepID=UPI00244AE53A|nr:MULTISPECIES: endonuclease/exonuclease/phosphatase family protein [unclassified Pseudomonas]MDH0301629.1 endonuclease/exonuclease/phosphatase family protein [Pseudomonas sp. GD04091]MDH1987261.1 endonuclease/exonuclease/phosphatase family protein [Pseudomonas sp. GD03689]
MNRPLPTPHRVIDEVTTVHRLTVLTLNVHKGFTLFNRRFILPELREAVRTTGADLVFLQEVHGSHRHHAQRHPAWPQAPQYEFLADSMWPQFAYGRNAVYPHGDHGNALLSKFPIRAHDNLDVSIHGNEERGLLHCQLEVPGHHQVHAICVHLGLREAHRQRQVGLLLALLDSLPADEPVIVAGDFNDWRLKADARLCGHLREAFGKPARSFPARLPLLRLDRIYLRNAHASDARVLTRYPWSHLSDHAPLVAEVTL